MYGEEKNANVTVVVAATADDGGGDNVSAYTFLEHLLTGKS